VQRPAARRRRARSSVQLQQRRHRLCPACFYAAGSGVVVCAAARAMTRRAHQASTCQRPRRSPPCALRFLGCTMLTRLQIRARALPGRPPWAARRACVFARMCVSYTRVAGAAVQGARTAWCCNRADAGATWSHSAAAAARPPNGRTAAACLAWHV
jgi:hypothetical protein